MEIVIPDFDDDDDDLPLPSFASHSHAHSFGQPTPPIPGPNPHRTRGDSDASFSFEQSSFGFAFPQTQSQSPRNPYGTGYTAPGSSGSLTSPTRGGFGVRAGSGSSQNLMQGQRGPGMNSQVDLGRNGIAPSSQIDLTKTGQGSSTFHPNSTSITKADFAPPEPAFRAPTKKPSFASFKNAFKSAAGGSSSSNNKDASAGYPSALKNPFNPSRNALPTSPPNQSRNAPPDPGRRPSATSGTSYMTTSQLQKRERDKKQSSNTTSSHASRPSGYSNSNTTASTSTGSLLMRPDVPVPALPVGLQDMMLSKGSGSRMGGSEYHGHQDSIEEDDFVWEGKVPEPKTPSEFALHVLFRRFVALGDGKVGSLLSRPLNQQPSLQALLSRGVDTAFDEILVSLAYVARRHARPVIDSIMGWRKVQGEGVSPSEVRSHLNDTKLNQSRRNRNEAGGAPLKIVDAAAILGERKIMTATFIVNRALIEILKSTGKDALEDTLGMHLERTVYDAFRGEHPEVLLQNVNRRIISEQAAVILGLLSKTRLLSVSDRFVGEGSELTRILAQANPSREAEMRSEHLIKGSEQFQLKIYPENELELAAEFLSRTAYLFGSSHGLSFKVAFTQTLVKLIHPLVQTATAEVNHPIFSSAIRDIHDRAIQMAGKPRYWNSAFPLVVITLCVSPPALFKESWLGLIDQAVQRLKERSCRLIALNSIVRLLWVYLNRCPESATSTGRRLDSLLEICFPPNTTVVRPPDTPLDPMVYMVHYILSKQTDYGQDLVMDLLQEESMSAGPPKSPGVIAQPERMLIALQSTLLTLQMWQEGEVPPWPATADFERFSFKAVDASYGEPLSMAVLEKPGVLDFFNRCGPLLGKILVALDRDLAHLSLFSEAAADPRHLTSPVDSNAEVITRRHQDLPVTYGRRFVPRLDLFTSVLHSFPRCLHPAMDVSDVAAIISRATIQVDPDTAQAACATLERLVSHHGRPETFLLGYTRFLFGPSLAFGPACCGSKGYLSQQERLVKLWVTLLETLTTRISAIKSSNDLSLALPVESTLLAQGEAGSLVLLLCHARSLRALALTALRSLDAIQQLRVAPLLVRRQSRMYKTSPKVERQTLLQIMERSWTDRAIQNLLSWPHLTQDQRSRLDTWYGAHTSDMAAKLAVSEHPQDIGLWTLMLPKVLQRVEATSSDVIPSLRIMVASLAVQFQRTVASVSGLTNRPTNSGGRGIYEAGNNSENAGLAEQWKHLLLTLCCITVRATGGSVLTPSDIANGLGHKRETLASGRELFLLITPSLTSDKDRFRDAAIHALGFVRQPLLLPLLQHLLKLSGHIADDFKHRGHAQRPPNKLDGEHSRLPTAIAQIYMLASFQVHALRLPQDRDALGLMIDFISETYMQLAEKVAKEDFELQRLRRYFCVLVQNMSETLPTLDPSAVMFPMKTRAAIFRLCDEWCTLGRRADVAKARESVTMLAAAERYRTDRNKAQYLSILQNDTRELSISAASAMASLCMGPLIRTDGITSPAQHSGSIDVEPLSVLQWIRGLFTSTEPRCHSLGRKALGELIKNNISCNRLIQEVIHQAYAEGDQFTLAKCFFGVLVRAQIKGDLGLTFAQIACLGLSKMGHTDVAFRVRALSMLETLFAKEGKVELSPCSGGAGSSSMKLYLEAQTRASQILAIHFPKDAAELVAECSTRVSQLDASRRVATLAILPPWLQNIDLSGELANGTVSSELSLGKSTRVILSSVFYISIRFGDDHPLEVARLWTSLSEGQSPINVSSIVIYLIGQATSRPNFEGFSHAKKAISYYAGTSSASVIFYSLCSLIEPAQFMVTSLADQHPANDGLNSILNLDSILGKVGQSQTISTGHVAMLFAGELLSEAMMANPDIAGGSLAILLHALMTQVDSEVAIVREQSQKLVYRTMATWSGSDPQWLESEDITDWESGQMVSAESIFEGFWGRNSAVEGPPWFIPARMASIISRVLDALSKNLPDIRQNWGEQALVWATECTVPHLACRSFQIFRILMPAISPSMLVSIMSRYSITAAGSTSIYQAFNREVLYTMCSIVQATGGEDLLAFPQLFWCIAAALSTPILEEYQLVVELLAHYLDKVDLGDMDVMRHLLDNQPPNWTGGEFKLQTMLLPGLRSSLTMEASFDIIRRLAGISFDNLIDSGRHRLMHLFVSSMPWLLTANDRAQADPEIDGLAEDIASLAEREGQGGLARIMTSLAKRRFRTKEDFIKQSASCMRDFLRTSSSEIVILLLGMVLNNENWIRNKAMLMLKLVFQDPEARKPLATYGSELLMPLLRLLSGPLASEALEVLDTTVVFSGVGGAANVLRMSMVGPTMLQAEQDQSSGKVFGVPDETGWCAAKPTEAATMTRRNIESVIATFDESIRVVSHAAGTALLDVDSSSVEATNARHLTDIQEGPDSLGDLVGALHTLSNFFEEEDEDEKDSGDFDDRPLTMRRKPRTQEPAGERRVRAILARSLIRRSSFDWTIEPPSKELPSSVASDAGPAVDMPPLLASANDKAVSPTNGSQSHSPDNEGDDIDPAVQFAQWRSQLHQHHASISSAGTHTSRKSETNFDLDTETAPPPDLAVLSLNRMQSPASSVGDGLKRPTRFRNLLLGRGIAVSPRQ